MLKNFRKELYYANKLFLLLDEAYKEKNLYLFSSIKVKEKTNGLTGLVLLGKKRKKTNTKVMSIVINFLVISISWHVVGFENLD